MIVTFSLGVFIRYAFSATQLVLSHNKKPIFPLPRQRQAGTALHKAVEVVQAFSYL